MIDDNWEFNKEEFIKYFEGFQEDFYRFKDNISLLKLNMKIIEFVGIYVIRD